MLFRSACLSFLSEHDDVLLILSRYENHPEVIAARAKYEEQEVVSRSAKPINFQASRRIFVEGNETPLTPLQKETKRFLECQLEQRINQLKSRMLEASCTRRLVIKEKKEHRRLSQVNARYGCIFSHEPYDRAFIPWSKKRSAFNILICLSSRSFKVINGKANSGAAVKRIITASGQWTGHPSESRLRHHSTRILDHF